MFTSEPSNEEKNGKQLQLTPPRNYLAVLYTICTIFLVIYVHFALCGWFAADDFMFLDKYQDSILFSEIWTLENFGRFLSRNLYFHVQSCLGNRSEICFLFNLIVLIVNSFLFYVLINKAARNRFVAVFGGCFYFTMLPSVLNLFWVSNIQQILSHLMIFVFLIAALDLPSRNISAWTYVRLGLVYILGLYANIAMVCVIPAIWCILFCLQESKIPYRGAILFTTCISVLTILFFVRMNAHIPGSYEAEYSASRLLSNILEYAGGYGVTNIIPKAGYILLSATFLACLLRSLIRADRIAILLFALAGCSFLPYGFLVHQKTVNYMALPLCFLTAGLVHTIVSTFSSGLVILFLSLIMMGQIGMDAKPVLKSFENGSPRDLRRLISNLNAAVNPGVNSVCLRSSSGNEVKWGLTGTVAADFWHSLGDGAAFNVFGRIRAVYVPFEDPPCIDRPTILISDDYRIVKIIDPTWGGATKRGPAGEESHRR